MWHRSISSRELEVGATGSAAGSPKTAVGRASVSARRIDDASLDQEILNRTPLSRYLRLSG
jgi:hypothetical protein